jgi:2,3-bisphosphoglycerate-independent phosphoglycerate mutase
MELGGKTPLEYANTPAMDSIAKRGASGTFLTLPDGLPTSSDVANMSVLGFKPEYNYPGRGPIEAAAQGIELDEDDIAWRCNLVYVSDDGFLRDYSAGHISPEDAAVLMADLETAFGSDEVTFYSGVSYRNLLVLHGKRFSPLVDYFKPDSSQDILLSELRLSAQTPEAQETVDFLIDLEEKAAKFLANHPINLKKKSPANRIWPWSPGRRPALPDFSQKYQQRTGAIISAVDVIRGLGMCSNMQVIEVPGATGFVDTNYDGKAQAAIKAIEEKDFVYLHLEAIDECSHLGDLKLKIQAIEEFDAKIVAPVLAALEGKGIRFAVLPDHPVPIKLRAHTTTPVPVAMMGPEIDVDGIESFSETLAPKGGLGYMSGDGLMKRLHGL